MARKPQKHWFALYQAMRPTIDSYDGGESVYTIIRQQAELAGYDEKVVKRMLKAGAFLDRICAERLTPDTVRCGYAHVELLERLQALDPALVQAQLVDVLANRVTLKTLRDTLDMQASRAGHAQTLARSKARSRLAEHQRQTMERAQLVGPEFFGLPGGEMALVKRFRTLHQFILIHQADQHPIAVLPRIGDSAVKEAKAAEDLLWQLVPLRRYFAYLWIVLPGENLLAQELAAQAHQVGLLGTWLKLAIPDQESGGFTEYRNLRQRLAHALEGDDDERWEGLSLPDRHKVSGTLKPHHPDTP